VMALALVGGRLGYVVVHASYFVQHPLEAVQVWQGGLSGGGALLGGLVGVALAAALAGGSALVLGDRLARLAALLTAAAWLGCWQVGSAYGLPSDGVLALPAPDEWGRMAPRLPVQLVGALAALGWMAVLDWKHAAGRTPNGMRGAAWLLVTGILMSLLSLIRGDPAALWGGLRVDTWSGLGVALAGLLWLLPALLTGRRDIIDFDTTNH